MNDKYFLDTNILVYAHDRSAGAKHIRAQQLVADIWRHGGGVISTQVMQELCINLRRKAKQPLAAEEVRFLLEDYLSWEVVVNSPQSVLRALDIEARYKINFWDALIIQAAESSAVKVVYSEDLAAGQKYGEVHVINPFVDSEPPTSPTVGSE
jgi:predicted nucleic acid-binding protein